MLAIVTLLVKAVEIFFGIFMPLVNADIILLVIFMPLLKAVEYFVGYCLAISECWRIFC